MKRRVLWAALCVSLVLCGKEPDDCTLQFKGKARKAVKLRSAAAGANYTSHNSGNPVTVSEWFQLVCSLDPKVPNKVPKSKAIAGAETVRVTLRGYLLAARFERSEDQDIHAEIGAKPEWQTEHVIVEVPPGPGFCDARKALWGFVRKDAEPQESDRWRSEERRVGKECRL